MYRARSLRVLALAGLLVGAAAVSSEAQTDLPPTGFQEGEPFPTLAFPALDDGDVRSLADFRGHKVVLHVFASW